MTGSSYKENKFYIVDLYQIMLYLTLALMRLTFSLKMQQPYCILPSILLPPFMVDNKDFTFAVSELKKARFQDRDNLSVKD